MHFVDQLSMAPDGQKKKEPSQISVQWNLGRETGVVRSASSIIRKQDGVLEMCGLETRHVAM